MTRRLTLTLFPLLACSGPAIRGGVTVPSGELPPGEVVASYVPVNCLDAAGQPAQWNNELRLVRNAAGEHVVAELRPDQDVLVIHRVSAIGQNHVFQVVVRDSLREIRLPVRSGSAGKMVVARQWQQGSFEGRDAATELRDVVLECALVATAAAGLGVSDSGADSGEAAGPDGGSEPPPAPEPPDGSPDPRTGY